MKHILQFALMLSTIIIIILMIFCLRQHEQTTLTDMDPRLKKAFEDLRSWERLTPIEYSSKMFDGCASITTAPDFTGAEISDEIVRKTFKNLASER